MIKVRYVCLLKCFLNILKQTNDSVLKIIKKSCKAIILCRLSRL